MRTVSQLGWLGCTHQKTDLAIREKLSIAPHRVPNIYNKLAELEVLDEALLLNTCNRVELYWSGNGSTYLQEQILKILYPERSAELCDHFDFLTGSEVVEHLYRVSSGLASQIVGETEILGQVKSAYEQAQEFETIGKHFHFLCQKASQIGKWSRSQTKLAQGHVSIGSIVTELSRRIFGDLTHTRVLLIGCGEVGESCLKFLQKAGASQITVMNRSFSRAENVAKSHNSMAMHYELLGPILAHYDVVIAGTAADDFIIRKEQAKVAISQRPTLPLFFIDLGVPRNIDPQADYLPNTFLYNMDDLAKISQQTMNSRKKEIRRIEKHIQDRVTPTMDKLFPQACTPSSTPSVLDSKDSVLLPR